VLCESPRKKIERYSQGRFARAINRFLITFFLFSVFTSSFGYRANLCTLTFQFSPSEIEEVFQFLASDSMATRPVKHACFLESFMFKSNFHSIFTESLFLLRIFHFFRCVVAVSLCKSIKNIPSKFNSTYNPSSSSRRRRWFSVFHTFSYSLWTI
jgi:hypothetical protein